METENFCLLFLGDGAGSSGFWRRQQPPSPATGNVVAAATSSFGSGGSDTPGDSRAPFLESMLQKPGFSASYLVCNLRWPTRDQNRSFSCNTRSGLFWSPSPVFYSTKMTKPKTSTLVPIKRLDSLFAESGTKVPQFLLCNFQWPTL
ncbi:hypothetical protein MRB53_013729 [Persea americana]|uniref:Uncharacterized protein n=1 Tax=Persea americana TaxID=3435 RepID=A0ACC2K8T7_PERAE|nr:hypothetical protein MRB53_013729 [Persea americana]